MLFWIVLYEIPSVSSSWQCWPHLGWALTTYLIFISLAIRVIFACWWITCELKYNRFCVRFYPNDGCVPKWNWMSYSVCISFNSVIFSRTASMGHGEVPFKIPHYTIYSNYRQFPQLLEHEERLKRIGLKDPWIRLNFLKLFLHISKFLV